MRKSTYRAVAITASLATTSPICLSDIVVGEIRNPLGSSITTLTWYVGETESGNFSLATDVGTGGQVSLAADRAMQLPTQLVGARYAKAVGDQAGTIYVSLKA
jgi:hypothetical protein